MLSNDSRMSPEPNDQNDKNMAKSVETSESEVVVNLVMSLDDEQNGSSEGSDSETENEYGGYKLLQQDEVPNGNADEEDDEDEEDEEDEDNESFGDIENGENIPPNEEAEMDINYQVREVK